MSRYSVAIREARLADARFMGELDVMTGHDPAYDLELYRAERREFWQQELACSAEIDQRYLVALVGGLYVAYARLHLTGVDVVCNEKYSAEQVLLPESLEPLRAKRLGSVASRA